MIKNHVDVLALAETKLDSTFPQQQFILDGFKQPYHLDETSNSGEILVYVNNQTSPMEINSLPIPNDIQAIPIESNLIKCKWLLFPIYKPPSQNEGFHRSKGRNIRLIIELDTKLSNVWGFYYGSS